MLASSPARPAFRATGLLLALLLCLTVGVGCGHSHHSHEGFVMVDNRSDTTTNEFLLAFRLAPFGHPFTGNLLPADLAPAATANLGAFQEEYYDADTAALVAERDRFIVERFGYAGPPGFRSGSAGTGGKSCAGQCPGPDWLPH